MNAAAGRLSRVIVVAVVATGLVTGGALAIAVPRFFLVEQELMERMWMRGVVVGISLVGMLCILAWRRIHRHRFTLRALGLGSPSIEPEALIALSNEPVALTTRAMALVLCGAFMSLVPGYRFDHLPSDASISIALLIVSFCATAALALHTFIRRRISHALLLAPEDVMREAIERTLQRGRTHRWTLRRILMTILVPVALVGISAAVIVHGHVLALEAKGRLDNAVAIAQCALEPIPGPVPTAGEEDASLAASAYGYSVRLFEHRALFLQRSSGSDRVVVTVPLELGHARLSFRRTTVVTLAAASIAAAAIATLFAAIVGLALGKALADDLQLAQVQVRALGTDKVIDGGSVDARPARFAVVARLVTAIDKLADRFRVFAAANQQAILARQATRHMRGLLFASVSHDLKSSLNAVLGFAELIDDKALNESQQESVQVIRSRARELLGLIRTILDGARVEAGHVVLDKQPDIVADLLRIAVRQLDEEGQTADIPIQNETTNASWIVNVDPDRFVDGVKGLLRFAVKTTRAAQVQMHAVVSPSKGEVLIDIDIPASRIGAATLEQLWLADASPPGVDAAGSLALSLSLARSLIMLNGAAIQAFDTDSSVVIRVSVPRL